MLRSVLQKQADLPLALLLAWNDLERTRVESRLLLLLMLLLLLNAGAALLGDLRPATACRLVVGRAGSVAVVDDTLVSKLAAAKEFLSEVAGIESTAGRVDGLGDKLGVSREAQQGGNEVLGYWFVSTVSIAASR